MSHLDYTGLKVFCWHPTFCSAYAGTSLVLGKKWLPKLRTCEVSLTCPFVSDPGPAHISRVMCTRWTYWTPSLLLRTLWLVRAPAHRAQTQGQSAAVILEMAAGRKGSPLSGFSVGSPAHWAGPLLFPQGTCSPPVSTALYCLYDLFQGSSK